MLRQMEWNAIQVMAKWGKSIRQIAADLGRSPTTIARVLQEPVDKPPPTRRRRSQVDGYRPQVDGYRPQIEQGIAEGLSNVRMLEQARSDPAQPYQGGRTVFYYLVRRIRRERGLLQARGRQRTDSTHVLGPLRELNRLECVAETLRVALDALAVAAPVHRFDRRATKML